MLRLILFGLLACHLFPLAGCKAVHSSYSEELLRQRAPNDCAIYNHNFIYEAPRLYSAGSFDTLQTAIDFVNNECGDSESLMALNLLLAIHQQRFSDTLLPDNLFFNLMVHRYYRDVKRGTVPIFDPRGPWFWDNRGSDDVESRFDRFRDTLAGAALMASTPGTPGSVLAQFYAGQYDSALLAMQQSPVAHSELGRRYREYIAAVKAQNDLFADFSLGLGAWRPLGSGKILGDHPELSLQIGGERRKWRVSTFLNYRWAKTEYQFTASEDFGQFQANKYDAIFTGADFAWIPLNKRVLSLDLFAGLGWDWQYTRSPENRKVVFSNSPVLSVGIRPRIFLEPKTGAYIGIETRYRFQNHDITNGTDISGNALNISLQFGVSMNATLRDHYKRMNYQGSWRPQR